LLPRGNSNTRCAEWRRGNCADHAKGQPIGQAILHKHTSKTIRCAIFVSFIGYSARKIWKPRILKEALEHATGAKKTATAAVVAVAGGRFPMKTVAEVIGVSRSNLTKRLQESPQNRIG
jgi:hypothetical protein